MGRVGIFALAAILVSCGGAPQRAAVAPLPTATPAPTLTPSPTPAPTTSPSASPTPAPTTDPATRLAGGGARLPDLAPAIPFSGHLLISDVGNKRIVEIAPSGEMTWSFPLPEDAAAAALGPWDDAYYSPDGATITANSAVTNTVIAIDVATRRIRWQAGTPGKAARGAAGFSSPDDAITALDGTIYTADILNCRVVHLSAKGEFIGALGSGRCAHDPPASFASPNGAYPTADGGLIVTEITGSWISRLAADGSLVWTVRAPVSYPSDAVPYPDGTVIVADYVSPGQVVRLAPDGKVIWRFDAAKQLHNPSSVQPLAANRVAMTDDFGNRILVVDPTTNEIIKEYTGAGGVKFRITDCVDFRPD